MSSNRQLKHLFSFMCCSLSSVVSQSISMAFGLVVLGAVYLGVNLTLLEVAGAPFLHPWISWNLLYCESSLAACSYHPVMSLGISGMAKIFCKTPALSPSMKYSMRVLSSLI